MSEPRISPWWHNAIGGTDGPIFVAYEGWQSDVLLAVAALKREATDPDDYEYAAADRLMDAFTITPLMFAQQIEDRMKTLTREDWDGTA